MSNTSDFIIENGVLKKYVGSGGTVAVPDHVTVIWQDAFRENTAITDVILPDDLVSIEQYAFRDCTNMETIRIPDSLKRIENGAFWGCKALREAVLPKEMYRLGICAFLNCSGLRRLVLPGKIERLAHNMFDGVDRLEELVIPCDPTDTQSITFIATNMFNLDVLIRIYLNAAIVTCEPMKKAIFKRLNTKPNRKKFFESWMQNQDPAMVAKFLAVIPSVSVEELNEYIRESENTPEICTLFLDYKNRHYTAEDLAAKAEEQAGKALGLRELTVADWKKIYKINSMGHITGYKLTEPVAEIPYKVRNTVFQVGSNAFKGCDFLERVTIADGVELIDNSAFNGCSKLTEITIPSTLTKIGASAFKNCAGLTHVTFPGSVANIGSRAFEGCVNLVIHAPAGSKIIKYAEKNNIPFKAE